MLKLPVWLVSLSFFYGLAGWAPGQEAPQPTGHEWEQEQNLALNKEAPRAIFASFGDLPSALKILPENSRYWRSLNGPWKFHWVKRPEERSQDFYKPDFDVSGWKEISVPSSWQCQGYGVPVYSNQRYLFKRDWPHVMGEPPTNYTSFINRNPVGSYRRDFVVPDAWAGREVFINFDGVDSFFYLWINGHYVGFSKDSRTPAAFNITEYLKPGTNMVAAEVYRFSDGSYLECQDMWRLSGIFRTVSLQAVPKTHIRDFFALPELDDACRDGSLKITGAVVGPDAANRSVAATLYDDAGKPVVSRTTAVNDAAFAVSLPASNPRKWSAESPNLYTLVLELKNEAGQTGEFVSAQVGFRKVEIRNGVFLVNNQPIKLKGVNRHENFPDVGHAVSREQMDLDLLRLKQANVNHVRTSHYPDDPYWYYLCNKYGIYLVDEANIESHGYYYGKDSLSHPPEWEAAHVARVMAMVERDKNHPCVVVWSLGNEAGPGHNFVVAEQALKARDTSRPTQYERNNNIVNLGSNQYPDVNWVWRAARGARGIKYPFYISEYAHIMNNALGDLADYWEAIESSDRVMGAAIWEWCDQGLYRTNADGVRYVAYGGDFGDAPNDGQFIVKGVVFADRTPKPCYYEVKKVYQNIAVSPADPAAGKVQIFNKYFFKDLSEFEIAWELTEDGDVIQSGVMPAPEVGPRQKSVVTVPFKQPDFKPGADYFLKLGFRLLEKRDWAPKGYELANSQVALPNPQPAKPVLSATGTLKIDKLPGAVSVSGKDFVATFDPKSGSLARLQYSGGAILSQGIKLDAFRCPLNNDVWTMNKWFEQGLRHLTNHVDEFKVEQVEDTVRLTASVVSRGDHSERCVDFGGNHTRVEPAGPLGEDALEFHSTWVWTVYPDGSIACQTAIAPSGRVIPLPRIGVKMELPENFNRVTWFGRGPEGNYPDRKTGSFFGQYSRSVRDLFVPYARPNDMANHEEVRWMALTDNQGAGVLFTSLDQPMSAAALPYSASELLLANHPPELPESHRTVLTLDAAVLGMGGASCGPGPLERDIPKSNQAYHLGFLIRPVTRSATLAEAARVSVSAVAPVAIVQQKNKLTLTTGAPEAVIKCSVNGGPEETVSSSLTAKTGDKVEAWAEKNGLRSSPRTQFVAADVGVDKSGFSIKFVSSQEPGEGNAEHLIDGDPDTFWHTAYSLSVAKYPHTVDIDLGEPKSFKAVAYLPRQSGVNGRVDRYRFDVSNDAKNWTAVAEGQFRPGTARQVVPLKEPVKARYLRFEALSELRGQDFASAAEIDIIP